MMTGETIRNGSIACHSDPELVSSCKNVEGSANFKKRRLTGRLPGFPVDPMRTTAALVSCTWIEANTTSARWKTATANLVRTRSGVAAEVDELTENSHQLDDIAQPQSVESHENFKNPVIQLGKYVHVAWARIFDVLCQDEQGEVTWHCLVLR